MKVLVIFLALFGPSLGQLCPPPELLAPCECFLHHEVLGNAIFCHDLRWNFDLKAHFDNVSSRFQEDHIFDTFILQYNPFLVRIEEGTIEHLKFHQIIFTQNIFLSVFHPRAFNASRWITKRIHMSYGRVINGGVLGNVFDFVRSFKKLQVFDTTGEELLTVIPPNAFANMSLLEHISFYNGNIAKIGSGAFSGCPKLKEVDLSGNAVPSEGLPEDAFGGITSKEAVFNVRSYHLLDWLEQRSYQALLDTAKSVCVGYEGSRTFRCDERADWICENEREYKGKLEGFNCDVQSGYEDIWEYCAGRNVTQS